MKNDVIFLKKLIEETRNDTIKWVKAEKPDIGWLAARDTWKGEKEITHDKKIAFVLSYSKDDYSYSEVNMFFINNATKVREMIYSIDPGFFSFKTIKQIKALINLLMEKQKDETARKLKEIIGPMPAKNFDEVVY